MKQKQRVVLRLLRGESLDTVAREESVAIQRSTQWPETSDPAPDSPERGVAT